MLKREWDAESSGKLPHLYISNKTANMVPKFAVEDLPLGRTAALVPEFAVKDMPLGRTHDDDDDDYDDDSCIKCLTVMDFSVIS